MELTWAQEDAIQVGFAQTAALGCLVQSLCENPKEMTGGLSGYDFLFAE